MGHPTFVAGAGPGPSSLHPAVAPPVCLLRNGRRVERVKLPLVPVRIRSAYLARRIELGYLCRRQVPACRGQILTQLGLIACADDYRWSRICKPPSCLGFPVQTYSSCGIISRPRRRRPTRNRYLQRPFEARALIPSLSAAIKTSTLQGKHADVKMYRVVDPDAAQKSVEVKDTFTMDAK
jgi:hypothetical protein